MSLVEAFSEFFDRIGISAGRVSTHFGAALWSFHSLSGAVMAPFIIPRHMIGERHKRCHEMER